MLTINKNLLRADLRDLSNNYLEVDSKVQILKTYGRIYLLEMLIYLWSSFSRELVNNGKDMEEQLIANSQEMIGNIKIILLLKVQLLEQMNIIIIRHKNLKPKSERL
jgi:hypothetical protein